MSTQYPPYHLLHHRLTHYSIGMAHLWRLLESNSSCLYGAPTVNRFSYSNIVSGIWYKERSGIKSDQIYTILYLYAGLHVLIDIPFVYDTLNMTLEF